MKITAVLPKYFNLNVLLTVTVIACLGFAMLYSAAGGSMSPWASKQIMRFLLGLILLFSIALTDIRFWRTASYPFYLVAFVLLIFVEIKGHIGMGAQRWIDLYVFQLQPSELMKIALIMALANYFHSQSVEDIQKLKTYGIPLILIGAPSLLVLRQPDLGTMMILAMTGAVVIFLAGIRLWKILTVLGIICAALPIFWQKMHTYQKNRVLTFLNPEQDPLGTGYHILQSKIAIGSGGFFGKGFMQGTQSQLNFLPEKQTDFIFAMYCEEFGALGAFILIALYGYIILYGFRVSLETKNMFGRLLSLGFTSLFFLYVFINIGMVMGLLPVVGVPLPFMSYGGTSMLSLMIGLGLLMSVSINRHIRFGGSF